MLSESTKILQDFLLHKVLGADSSKIILEVKKIYFLFYKKMKAINGNLFLNVTCLNLMRKTNCFKASSVKVNY